MPVIPVINKDLTQVSKEFNDKIHEPKHQRNLVLIIVCIALLLDNMLYMVIVPIIPEYLEQIDADNAATARFSTVTQPSIASSPSPAFMVAPLDPRIRGKQVPPVNATVVQKAPPPPPPPDNDDDEDSDESEETTTTTRTSRTTVKNRVVYRTTSSMSRQPSAPATPLTTLTTTPSAKDNDGADDVRVGFLFASKAMVQLCVNPLSGAFIDRIGYDIPMFIGLVIIFLSTMTFSFGGSYAVLFLARSLQGVGSAFADTSGLAMIADRFTEEGCFFVFARVFLSSFFVVFF